MDKSTTKTKKSDRWVVARDKDFIEARRKGLYKSMVSFAAKEQFNLAPTHIGDIVSLVTDAIEQQVLKWHESGCAMNEDEENYHLMNMERMLYILEDLFPYYFVRVGLSGENYIIGDEKLFRTLGRIRELVAFPSQVEKFYLKNEAADIEKYRKSTVCGICGGKQANVEVQNLTAHEDCFEKYGWYRCDWCGWHYPNNKKRCNRKEKCNEKELLKCTSGDF